MDERGPVPEEGDREPSTPSAGAANTPSFGSPASEPDLSGEGGRPPSHREYSEAEHEERYESIAPADAEARESLGGEAERIAEQARERGGEAFEEAGRRLDEEADRLAGRIEDAAEGWEERAEKFESESARRWSERAAEAGEAAADYLRDTDFGELRSAVERQVRERPLQTLLIAAAAGWLLGKLVR